MAEGIGQILEEMKEQGIGGVVIRKDGLALQSTLAMDDVSASLISSIANITKAMMEKTGDEQSELEIAFDSVLCVIVPGRENLLCLMLKSREEKRKALDLAKKALPYL